MGGSQVVVITGTSSVGKTLILGLGMLLEQPLGHVSIRRVPTTECAARSVGQ